MSNDVTRRHFLARAVTVSAAFAALRVGSERGAFAGVHRGRGRLGPLAPDPAGVFDLPGGFEYRVLSRAGETMDDGLIVPGAHDGMAAFPGPAGKTVIVRNHELSGTMGPDALAGGRLAHLIDPAKVFDAGHGTPSRGGTTTLVYDTSTRTLDRHFLSLAGTERNCAGGATPRGTWITCEETIVVKDETHEQDHGWCFEVPASPEISLADPKPIRPMGRFNHEATCTDPRTGIVYLTEDRSDGLLYRYVPDKADDLHAGGKLQALAIQGRPSFDTRNWEGVAVRPGDRLVCTWVDLQNVEAPEDDLRFRGHADGAARFARGEGMWWGRGAAYFACTNGGARQLGQLWRLRPGVRGERDTLDLFLESTDPSVIENADNICIAPWGDVVVCEDGAGTDHLLGVTRSGEVYPIGRNAASGSELAGATFSPDGSTLFVNVQHPGLTLAITGPWPSR